ncbi:hypothetical protein EJ04DRAFT_524212 [Polyplosphaeria fusca]|uniref:Uncharacterized protein n=1 Tax=Polyplosphaeria fusca TaxID=682080 RepID=A0A9P4QTW9_9PLEO|nr:hypothetical protein EJ04DRAFT_524212 [Polyplosphaeria fusca]
MAEARLYASAKWHQGRLADSGCCCSRAGRTVARSPAVCLRGRHLGRLRWQLDPHTSDHNRGSEAEALFSCGAELARDRFAARKGCSLTALNPPTTATMAIQTMAPNLIYPKPSTVPSSYLSYYASTIPSLSMDWDPACEAHVDNHTREI